MKILRGFLILPLLKYEGLKKKFRSYFQMKKRNIGIFLFNGVEVLDFAGPFEVFSTASRVWLKYEKNTPFELFTFANFEKIITARGGLKILADYTFKNVPQIDLLIVPGGVMDEPLNQREVNEFIKNCKHKVEIIASVCTGVFLLAQGNLLKGLRATTHWEDLAELKGYGDIKVLENVKFVDEGNIITSGGISSGITMSLHLISKLISKDHAKRTAFQMEYPYEL